MKNILVITFLFCSVICDSQVEKVYQSKLEKKSFYDQLTQKYSSGDIQNIWKSDAKEQQFTEWVDGNKESELIDDFGTVIHELFHGQCESFDGGQNYVISKGITIKVNYTEVYKSTELNSVFRKGQQDSITRYALYVGGKNEFMNIKTNRVNTSEKNQVSSISQGIYGMLEEFGAYYHGTKSSLELLQYFKDKNLWSTEDGKYDFKHMVTGDGIACYEFRLFMGNYLLYAKKKYPDIYKNLYDNKALRVTYTLLMDKFDNLWTEIHQVVDPISDEMEEEMGLMSQLDFSGSDEDMIRAFEILGFDEDDEIFKYETKTVNAKVVKKIIVLDEEEWEEVKIEYKELEKEIKESLEGMDPIMFYYGSPSLQIKYLKSQLKKDIQEELDKFKINGVNETNYKNYLK